MSNAGLFSRLWHRPPGSLAAVRLLAAFALIAAGGLSLLAGSSIAQAQSDEPLVRVVELDATIDIVSARYLKGAITNANNDGAELIIIELDTPGGTLDSTRDMVTAILESDVPVAVFVSPEGAQAASAGTFISAASGFLAMAPATNIGAASPVDGSGGDLPDTLESKVTQDTAAFIRSIAEERGRNVSALEDTVLTAASYSASEAVDLDIADIVVRDIDELLEAIDGRSVPVFDGSVTVNTTNAQVDRVGMSLIDRVISFIANPNIAFLLISLGTVGLIVELWNPGLFIPGTLGVAFLALGWVGVGNLDFSWAGVIFLALAIVLFVLEAQNPGVSYFGIAGGVALIIGGVFLVSGFTDPNLPGGTQTVSLWVLGIFGGSVIAFVLWLSWQVRQAAKSPLWVSEGATSGVIGQQALVTADLDPEGEVHVGGEFWSAEIANAEFLQPGTVIKKGDHVRVDRIDGVKLIVKPLRGGLSTPGDDSAPASV